MPFFIFSLIVFSLWKTLYSMFPFVEHESPFFFYRIVGQSGMPLVYDTLFIFSILALLYLANYLFLVKEHTIPFFLKSVFFISTLGVIVCCIFLYPIGSRDFFDYLIYLKQAYFYHKNPYVDSVIFYNKDTFLPFGFLLNSPLIYGPSWLFISGLPSLFSNFTNFFSTVVIFKSFNALFVIATGLIIYLYQDVKQKKFLALYLFLANPFILYEGIVNAHNDVMMAFFLVLSLYCLKKKSILALPFFITAVMIKFFVVILIPVFIGIMIRNKIARNKIFASLLLTFVITCIYCIPFWHGGEMIKGLSKGIQISQRNIQASLYSFTVRYFLTKNSTKTGLFSSIQVIYIIAFLLSGFIVFIQWVKKKTVDETAMVNIYLLFILLVSTLYPWYMITAIALMSLISNKTNIVFLFSFTFVYFLYLPLGTLLLNVGYGSFQLANIETALLSGVIIIYFIRKFFDHSPFTE